MNNLQIFNNEQFGQVRVAMKNNEPWFVAKDVCNILDISKYRDAVSRLDEDERGSVVLDTPGGKQNINAVNEPGLYNLIFGSRKPEAKQFKRWVTHEVLPEIRKTGAYHQINTMNSVGAYQLLGKKVEQINKLGLGENRIELYKAAMVETSMETGHDFGLMIGVLDDISSRQRQAEQTIYDIDVLNFFHEVCKFAPSQYTGKTCMYMCYMNWCGQNKVPKLSHPQELADILIRNFPNQLKEGKKGNLPCIYGMDFIIKPVMPPNWKRHLV